MLENKKIAFHNLGCKVNSYETDAMKRELAERGCVIVPFEEKADIYIINTCSVTNIADRKSRQMISRARKNNPEAFIVATGCYAETRKTSELENECADLYVGNNLKGNIANIITDNYEILKTGSKVIRDEAIDNRYDDMLIERADEHTRAFIKIQDGCNQFCTYCIIPFARGRVRSRRKDDIINEVKMLASNGYKEIVVTGIHISSYGSDFTDENKKKCADRFEPELLLEVIKSINEVEGVERIRLGSLEPRIMSEDFVKNLSEITKLCPHFHLSLQSGCNSTLKRMNRHYDCDEFYERVNLLRKYFNHPGITTDIIVGFPGETKEEFQETKTYLEKIQFYETHIFKYSKRAGTIAASLPNQLTEKEKAERSDELEAMERCISSEFRRFYLGKTLPVLFEEEKEFDNGKYMIGHTPEYVKVAVQTDTIKENTLADVKVTGFLKEDVMLGEISCYC